MSLKHSDEFKRDAVRIALTSGLTRRQVASDLSIGLSTLGKWIASVSIEAGNLIDLGKRLPGGGLQSFSRKIAVRFQFVTDYRGSLTFTYMSFDGHNRS